MVTDRYLPKGSFREPTVSAGGWSLTDSGSTTDSLQGQTARFMSGYEYGNPWSIRVWAGHFGPSTDLNIGPTITPIRRCWHICSENTDRQ